mmetsp:Transcript_4075/g.7910  ORF Transcript_4075/g.7910 Transcript_4075/m.7910 type:complete len:224 (+) Transcript_4075:110-781(+)
MVTEQPPNSSAFTPKTTSSTNACTFWVSNRPYSWGRPMRLKAALCMSGEGDAPMGLPRSQNFFLGRNRALRCAMMAFADICPGAATGKPSRHTGVNGLLSTRLSFPASPKQMPTAGQGRFAMALASMTSRDSASVKAESTTLVPSALPLRWHRVNRSAPCALEVHFPTTCVEPSKKVCGYLFIAVETSPSIGSSSSSRAAAAAAWAAGESLETRPLSMSALMS